MDPINIVVWLIVGGVVGLVVSFLIETETGAGRLADVIVGALGGLIGGYILNILGVASQTDLKVFHLPSAAIALIGAAVLLAVLEILRRANR
jgi:uncharacterized membrane protein YeaQ/YmgE (transglycosylase-associated protein family)